MGVTLALQRLRVPLVGGGHALIDEDDYALVAGSPWYRYTSPAGITYAIRSARRPDGRRTTERMHRIILGVTERWTDVDHIDGNGLNNTRSNLRACARAQNLANQRKTRGRSRFKGVTWIEKDAAWRAQVGGAGERRSRHCLPTEEAAARAYDEMALELYGPFARLNFPRAP